MCHQVSPPAPFLAVLYRIAQPVNMAWKCFECCFISGASNADPISEHNRSKHIHSPEASLAVIRISWNCPFY